MNSTSEDRKDENDATYEIGGPVDVLSFKLCVALSLFSHISRCRDSWEPVN